MPSDAIPNSRFRYGKPPGCTDLDQFSAACFYFAMGLTHRMLAEGSSEVGAARRLCTGWG